MAIHPDIERVALLGWHLYPVASRSKAGCFKGAADAATCDLEQLDRWATTYPGCNWRVVVGPSNLFALDVDRPGTHQHDGFAALKALTEQHGPIPTRPMTKTGGSGGAVLFFEHRGEQLRGESGQPAPGLDPHRGRQAIMIPPSLHPITGGAYTWRQAPWDIAPPPIPAWLTKLLAPPKEFKPDFTYTFTTDRSSRRLRRAIDNIMSAAPGTANVTLNRESFAVARHVAAGTMGENEAVSTIYAAARARSIPDREARDTIRSGFRAGARA